MYNENHYTLEIVIRKIKSGKSYEEFETRIISSKQLFKNPQKIIGMDKYCEDFNKKTESLLISLHIPAGQVISLKNRFPESQHGKYVYIFETQRDSGD